MDRTLFARQGWVGARKLALLAGLACFGLLGTGYFLEFVQNLHPCPLCVVQRGVLYLLGVSFLLTAWVANGQRTLRVAQVVLALFSLLGVALAGRHIWIQQHPELAIPSCFAGLEAMFDELPLPRFFQSLLNGTVECSKIDWSFLGLSIPQWTLLWFIAFFVLGLVLPKFALRRR